MKTIELQTKKNPKSMFKSLFPFLSFLLYNFSAMAQSAAIKTKITGWQGDIQTVLNAAVLVFAVAGGFLIFVQYMQGNDQAQKNFIKFVIGLGIFAIAKLIVGVFVTAAP